MLCDFSKVKNRIRKDWDNYKVGLIVTFLLIVIFSILGQSLCMVKFFTGIPCPGCGMSRSFFYLLIGEWQLAWQMHPFSFACVIFVLFLVWDRYLLQREGKRIMWMLTVLCIGMLGYYVYRMILFFPEIEPMCYEQSNFIYYLRSEIGR